jgi:hypothetical protein
LSVVHKRRKELKFEAKLAELRSEKISVTEEVKIDVSEGTTNVKNTTLPKVEILSMVKKVDTVTFPMYGWKKATGLTVMFLSNTNGIVINPGTSNSKLGLVSNAWNDCTNKAFWELLDEVTIIYRS